MQSCFSIHLPVAVPGYKLGCRNDERNTTGFGPLNMIGTILNAAGILIGGGAGLLLIKQLSPTRQVALKGVIALLTIFVGLKTTWSSLGGSVGHIAKQLIIIILALTLGRLLGRILHLQKSINRLGRYAQEKFSESKSDSSQGFSEGFITCSLLFCVGPMAILGSIQDGIDGRWQTLGIKALMDGLAAMAFVTTFGWGVLLSVIPVVAYQGTITMGAKYLAPFLQDHALMDSVNGTGGLLVFCIALIILEIRKVELADYLPSLAMAPLLTWWWR